MMGGTGHANSRGYNVELLAQGLLESRRPVSPRRTE